MNEKFTKDGNCIYVNFEDWNNLIEEESVLELGVCLIDFKDHINSGGSVIIKTRDENHVKHRMDSLSDIKYVVQEANRKRRLNGLDPVDGEAINL